MRFWLRKDWFPTCDLAPSEVKSASVTVLRNAANAGLMLRDDDDCTSDAGVNALTVQQSKAEANNNLMLTDTEVGMEKAV
jgi:hypothetical protein